jgi:hypothetical protein
LPNSIVTLNFIVFSAYGDISKCSSVLAVAMTQPVWKVLQRASSSLSVLPVHTLDAICRTIGSKCQQHFGMSFALIWPYGESLTACISFLYTLFLAIDANFKLKGKDRGIDDIELAPGWGCFVEEKRYQEHLAQYVDQPEVSVLDSHMIVLD